MNILAVFPLRMAALRGLLLFAVLSLFQTAAIAQAKPEPLIYLSSGAVRQGYVYKPAGSGPFPVMVYNQATAKPCVDMGDPTPFSTLAKYYNEKGWAFFLPGRPSLLEMLNDGSKKPVENEKKKFVTLMEAQAGNIGAAIVSLKAQSFADPNRIFVSGHAAGAISSLLLARTAPDVRGFILFSPAVANWGSNELLREALIDAARKANAPIFLIQPQNDTDLQPIEGLGPELTRRGSPNRSKIFEAVGSNPREASAFAYESPRIWGDDVFKFIKAAMADQN